MSTEEQKPKLKGKKAHRGTRAYKKEFTTAMVGLEENTFDIRQPKYATKYERSVDAIARHVQQDYKSGVDVMLAMRDLVEPTVTRPTYPTDPDDQEAYKSGRRNFARSKHRAYR